MDVGLSVRKLILQNKILEGLCIRIQGQKITAKRAEGAEIGVGGLRVMR